MTITKLKNIKQAFSHYNLTSGQLGAIEKTLEGYTELIEASLPLGASMDIKPTTTDIKIYVDLIKSNLVNLLNALGKK